MMKIFIKIFLIVLTAQMVAGCQYFMSENEKEAQKYFELANEQWKSTGPTDVKSILENYSRAITLNPDLADAYIGRSVFYALGGNFAPSEFKEYGDTRIKAMEDCTSALKADPYSARAYRWRAYLTYLNARLNGEYDVTVLNRVLEDLNKAIKIDHDYLDAYEMRADTYMELKMYPQAIDDYTHILTYPDFKNASYMKYYDFDLVDAWAWYVDWDQRIAHLYNKRGDAYCNNGEVDKSLDDYERALKLSPNNPWIGRPFGLTLEQAIAEKNLRNASK